MANIAAGLDIRSTVDVTLINEIDPTTIIQRDGWIVTKDVVACTSAIKAHGQVICTTNFLTLKNNKHYRRLTSSRFPLWQTDCKSRWSVIPTTMPGNWKRPRDASGSRQDVSWCVHQ
jgi:hypothetical protein